MARRKRVSNTQLSTALGVLSVRVDKCESSISELSKQLGPIQKGVDGIHFTVKLGGGLLAVITVVLHFWSVYHAH